MSTVIELLIVIYLEAYNKSVKYLVNISSPKCDALKRNCLSEIVQEYWNKLPIDIKMAPNINSFKNKLESYKSDCIDSKNV